MSTAIVTPQIDAAVEAEMRRIQRLMQADGLSTIDASGVVLGNDDLADSCTWVPTEIPAVPAAYWSEFYAAELVRQGIAR